MPVLREGYDAGSVDHAEETLKGGNEMKEPSIMKSTKCQDCRYLETRLSTHGGIRRHCYCEHPRMKDSFDRYGGHGAPGFVAFSVGWSRNPAIKTSPRWCPLRRVNGPKGGKGNG